MATVRTDQAILEEARDRLFLLLGKDFSEAGAGGDSFKLQEIEAVETIIEKYQARVDGAGGIRQVLYAPVRRR